MSNLPKPSEVNADNIIKPNLEELSAEHRQAYEEYKKAREEKELQEFLANFKKDRQGNITPVGEIKFPPLQTEQVKPSVSTTFSPEQWAEIESRITDSNNLIYQAFLDNTNAQKNMPNMPASMGNPDSALPISSVPLMPMNYFPTHTNQIVAAPLNPFMQSSVVAPNQVGGNTARSLPNYGSANMPQFTPMVANPNPSMPVPQASSSTTDDALARFREEMAKTLRENFGVELPRNRIYQKPYPEYFDAIPCPQGYKIPDFVKFNGEGTKTTWEHVSQYLAQLGEAGSINELKVRLFPLSLTGTAFSWFSSLPHGSIRVWSQLEQKFHDHFYSGDNELKLSHLTSVKQKHDESVSDYVKRFRETKNRCYM